MESSELSKWLKANGFVDYCKVFWDAGLRDLKSVASITKAQLKEAGVVIRNKRTANELLREFHKLRSGTAESPSSSSASSSIKTGQSGKVYVALCNYSGTEATDLVIKEGDLVFVLDSSRDDKWRGIINQNEVFFPSWVVEEDPVSGSPSDTSEVGSSVPNANVIKEQHSKEQSGHKHTLLEVSKSSEPDEAFPSSTDPEDQVSSVPSEQESKENSQKDSTGSGLTQNVGNSEQPGLEPGSQKVVTSKTGVSVPPVHVSQPGVPQAMTGPSEEQGVSPSPDSVVGSGESTKSTHGLGSSSHEDQPSGKCGGNGTETTRPTETTKSTETTALVETAESARHAESARSNGTSGSLKTARSLGQDAETLANSDEPAKKMSKVITSQPTPSDPSVPHGSCSHSPEDNTSSDASREGSQKPARKNSEVITSQSASGDSSVPHGSHSHSSEVSTLGDDNASGKGSQEPARKKSKTEQTTSDTSNSDQKPQNEMSRSKAKSHENQKQSTDKSTKPPPGRVQDCPGVHVEFHVVIHEEWKFDPGKGDKSVHIRFGRDELGNWKWNCVDMKLAVDSGTTKHLRLIGSCTIPTTSTHKTIAYKYVVVSKDGKKAKPKETTEYEFITEGFHHGNVNRALKIPPNLKGKSEGFFRKYDDIIRKQPTRFYGAKRNFDASEFVENRKLALEVLLPRWPGFCGSKASSQFYSNLSAEKAIEEFDRVVSSVKEVPVWEDNQPESYQRSLTSKDFTDRVVAEVVYRYMQPQLEALLKPQEESGRLLSAVTLSILVKRYELKLNFDHAVSLLKALKLDPDLESRRCMNYDALTGHFTDSKMPSTAVEYVIRVSCVQAMNRPCEWVLALPLLHFLRHDIRPFHYPETADLGSPQWWGLENLMKEVKLFSIQQTESKSPITLIEEILPLCSADRLTARSFLYSLPLQQLPRAMEAGSAHPSEFLEALYDKLLSAKTITSRKTIETIDHILKELLAKATETEVLDLDTDFKFTQSLNECGVISGVQLLRIMPTSLKFQDKEMMTLLLTVKDITFTFVHKLAITDKSFDHESEDTTSGSDGSTSRQSHNDFNCLQLQEALRSLSEWMERNSARSLQSVSSIVEELQVWSKLLQSDILPDELKQNWERSALGKIKCRMDQAKEVSLVEAYCQISEQSPHPVIVQCFEDLSEKIVDRLLKQSGGQEQAVNGLLNKLLALSTSRDHSVTMLKLILRKSCPKSSPSSLEGWMEWFRHLLSWSLWTTLFCLTGDGSRARSRLDSEGQLVSRAESVLIATEAQLSDLSITVEQLRLLERNKNRFLELCKVWDSHQKDVSIYKKAFASLQSGMVEIRNFEKEKYLVDIFVGACVSICAVTCGLSDELKRLSDTLKEDISFKTLKCITSNKVEEGTYFPVPQSCRRFLQPIANATNSHIFKTIWVEKAREVHQHRRSQQPPNTSPLLLSEISELICTPVIHQWQRLCDEIQDGTMTLERVSCYFGCLTNNPPALTKELNCISVCSPRSQNNAWKRERQEQIEQYNRLKDKIQAARTLKTVLDVLEFSQSFREIDLICLQASPEFQQQPISVLSDDLLSAGKFLSTFTEHLVRALKSFVEAPNLILWLRQEIKEWKELETFVELAGTKSSEEGDLETVKVAHLHAACAGFAPLLFDVDRIMTFRDLQLRCEKVFSSLIRDRDLISKWVSTGRCLEDFKFTRTSLSSVEVSSFSQLEMINSRGRYQVGCLKSSSSSLRSVLTTDDCVKLVIKAEGEESTGTGKMYLLSDLLDLQSKLMLISGRSDKSRTDQVDAFVDVLERAVALANVYIDMSKAGHDKYLDWKLEFGCTSGSRFRDMAGRNESLRELLCRLDAEKEELTNALKEWREDVEHFRHSHYYLNYFTTPQLLILRQQLGQLVRNGRYRLPGEVFSLLGTVNPACTQQSVMQLLSLQCAGMRSSRLQDFTSLRTALRYSESDVRHIMDMGFPRDSVLAALNATKGDVNMAVGLCLERGPHYRLGDDQPGEDEDLALAMSLSLEAERGAPAYENVLSDQGSYITLDILGRTLQELASSSSGSPERSFPGDQFRVGEPNLLVIPHNEIFLGILSLYMRDAHTPLPSAQEVLQCCSRTTLEEVSLFWRRMLGDPGYHRLFCLSMADQLTYEVSRKSWEEFCRLAQNRKSASSGSSYKVVIICSTENEDKSYMVDALDPYRRANIPLPSTEKAKSYLKEKLQLQGARHSSLRPASVSAASLDHERSSVRVVRSSRAGDGKSFCIDGIADRLTSLPQNIFANSLLLSQADQQLHIVVPLHDQKIDRDTVMQTLRPLSPSPDIPLARLIHVDVLSSTSKGLDTFLFSLLVLGQISDSEGYVWRKRPEDLYIVEMTAPLQQHATRDRSDDQSIMVGVSAQKRRPHIPFTDLLPTIRCGSPLEAQEFLTAGRVAATGDPDMADGQFRNSNFQRAFQYLTRFERGENLDPFKFRAASVEGNHMSCVQTLLSNCGIRNPSWAEIKYFVSFLSSQLRDCENNDFCNPEAYGEDLPGFKAFVLKLMIHMSRDFATPSLDYQMGADVGGNELLEMRRRWEHSSHPYLFFNEDRHSVTFVEVQITRDGRLLDPRSGQVLDTIMSRDLSTALYTQGFRLQENYDNWTKARKLEELCRVMGVANVHDPDETYELTMDNVKKILAIQMRFRCGIPVIVMGETGCGKTRLIRYMCALQANLSGAKNMILMKVHGGVTRADIINKVKEAEDLARHNRSLYSEYRIQTVLFFDEANTTDALGLIKEVMCDKRINGKKVEGLGSSLQIIAACNPYRKHTAEMIDRLEAAGLGYHVKSDETEDKLGHIPLRQLVYRVHALPDSMKALVWDFGQLDQNIERLYVRQIVNRHVEIRKSIPNSPGIVDVITNVFAAAQAFMRMQKNECSFVSLRDVERAMMVMIWFYKLRETLEPILINKHDMSQDKLPENRKLPPFDSITRSLVLALGVCYQARLHDRRSLLEAVVQHFRPPCTVLGGVEQVRLEIKHCQEAFLDELELPPQIAKNHALSENVFMMVVCIDLRIPLFLVGKPGSSKSLAKDVVKNAMKGQLSGSTLFQSLKQLHMVSYQCSPLSTADGIIGAFQQCQRAQKQRDQDRFVACVVLDEVGLAEDSPRLPLKALHPLLDDGTAGADDTDEVERANRVAFVGLSNWALDPAKMNRGILVNREVPNNDELVVSAQGICSSANDTVKHSMNRLVDGMASAYRDIYMKQKREFFGLRDFYSLVKMVFAFCQSSMQCPRWSELEHSVRRNFGGQEQENVVEVFRRCCPAATNTNCENDLAIDNSTVGLIRANLQNNEYQNRGESRYLLLLTKNYAALNIIRQRILDDKDPVIIFGSSFPKDQEYTQICRTINRIKVCMATGRTVVLLNLDKLYESLYDALNQYYVYHGGQRFVDLGLGNHRVKCQVHKDFRLILVAERDVVYEEFPIPLINRMEKHFLAMESVLSPDQQVVVDRVNGWAKLFAEVNPEDHFLRRGEHRPAKFQVEDAFIGFNQDTAATLVLQAYRSKTVLDQEFSISSGDARELDVVFDRSVNSLLNCATPDAVARLHVSSLRSEARRLWDVYFNEQNHSSLLEFLKTKIARAESEQHLLLQVTTHSRLLSALGVSEIRRGVGLEVEVLALQQFDTEQQFEKKVGDFYECRSMNESVLLVQCEAGDINSDLIACSRYLIQEQRDLALNTGTTCGYSRHLVFVIQLPRVASSCFVGFQGGAWEEVHIDELRPANQTLTPSITSLANKKISSLLGKVVQLGSDDPVAESTNEIGSETMDNVNPEMCVEGPPVLNAEALLRACVHGAVSRLDEQEQSLDNASKRIHILLQLLPDDTRVDAIGCDQFYNQLKLQVIRLLEERDSRMDVEATTNWVRNEALSHNSLQVGGTFRRALWLRVINTVTPILAEIIAFLDRNFNLLMMEEAAAGVRNWLTTLWLDIFTSTLVSQHRYDFLSPLQNEVGQRIRIVSGGFRANAFQALFPFSGVIKSEVDVLMLEAKRMANERNETVHVALERLFKISELGAVIDKAQQCEEKVDKEISTRYLHDFVRMVYYATSEEEYKLVESAILCGWWELVGFPDEDPSGSVVLNVTIPTIHCSFEHIRSRIYCFREMVRIQPDIVLQLYQQIGAADRQELLVDVMAASMVLEGLRPDTSARQPKQHDQWLKRVQAAKPVVDSCMNLAFPGVIRNALWEENRNIWAACSAVKLFAEHTHSLAKDPFVSDAATKLYKCIKDVQVNFAKANTIGIIQRFLNESSKDYATKMFGPNGDECIICRTEWINKNPVSLTCKHIFCRSCLDRHLERSRNCPVCSTAIPENFQQSSNDQLILAGETYRSFRRCSTAFFMELLSVYSFCESASELPEQELVRMLMELVVQGPLSTRPFSPFSEDAIDPRPVVRSFILQLLLKYNLPVTMEYVEMVFANARKFIQGDNVGDMEDLCVLFVDCMEDSLHQHSCISPFDERIFTAVEELRNSRELLRAEKHTVRHLQGVAVARFGLTIAAQALGDLLVNNERAMSQEHDASMMSVPSNVNSPSIAQLLSAARVVINEDIEDPQLGLFLVKQLMRSKGLDIIDRLQEKYGLEVQWLAELLQQDANEAAIPDYFVVLGERYMRFREAVARTVASGEIRFIDDLVKKCAGQNVVVPILLAIYREITCVRALPLNRQIPHTVLTSVESHCNQGAVLPAWAKSHAADLINNSQGRPLPQLQVVPGIDAQNRCLAGLALHIFTTVSSCDGAGLVQPLHLMLTQPKTLENSFWPTMPEDYFMEARNLVQGTRWYECKNGHPYLVPNCGKPVVTLRCPDCGESIGMNTNDPNARTHASTQKGHVLGLATRRSQEATPERDLSPPACALIRLLMHGVLVWASCSQDQNVSSGVADVVRPPVLQENLPAFFWSHFELDSRLFAKAIGRSVEDSVVVVHKLLEHINKSRGAHQERVAGGRLVSVQERKEWETTFSQRYVAPVFKEMQTKMTDWLQNVMNDQNLGNNPVVRRVYELEQPGSSKSSPRLWRYRIRVSVDHLTHTLEQNMMSSECKLLREFLKQESKLRALQYLPDVVKLQRLLMDKYDGRISLQEARTFRVGRFLNSIKDREEKMKLERLIEKFNMAWGLIRNHVLSHGRLKPKNKDHELLYITKETPLAYLLPRTVDEGTCATALVDYLVNSVHNEFLVTYRRLSGSEWEPERVPLEFVTSAHLVAYDVEKDLMPLVLAHCDYSLSVGQGTNITYNLSALEKQIVDRFVNGKAHVEMKDCRIAFRKDIYNSSLFVRLQQRIRQDELPLSVQRQITSDFHDLTDVYSVLAVLDIAIGFIVSAGGSSDTMLHKYIHETLKMPAESGIVSTRAQQHCRLKHVRSLWRLLTVVKGRRLCLANQEPFEHVSPAYRVKMDAATCQSLEKALRKLNIEAFLLEMVEIITLELQRWEETANMEQYELRLAMEELYGSKLHGLNHIPPQVQLKHLLHCWKVAVKFESELSGTK